MSITDATIESIAYILQKIKQVDKIKIIKLIDAGVEIKPTPLS